MQACVMYNLLSEMGRLQALTSTHQFRLEAQDPNAVYRANQLVSSLQTIGQHSIQGRTKKQDVISRRRVREEKGMIERTLDPNLVCILGD